MAIFPKDFLWGTATSSFQSEGAIENDFTDWEKQGRFRTATKNPLYGRGANHWQQWESDYKLLKESGQNSYRFSLEWARIVPEVNQVCHKSLDQYDRMIDRLCSYNITPMMTLHHFSHPHWFHQKSPWHTSESIESFLAFCEIVTDRFSDRVNLYNTFNEPLVWALAAYGDGLFPPGYKNLDKMMLALFNMLSAHSHAYTLIKSKNASAQIGIAKHFIAFRPYTRFSILDRTLSGFFDNFFNKMIPRAFSKNRLEINLPFLIQFDEAIDLKERIDFWGINYYYRLFVRWRWNRIRPFELIHQNRYGIGVSDLQWEIFPPGLQEAIEFLRIFKKDIYITENGIATLDDSKRTQFLQAHFDIITTALKRGEQIKGYYHWSLLDNYEWLEGTDARFGLVDVDYENCYKRTAKRSLFFYRDYINNAQK